MTPAELAAYIGAAAWLPQIGSWLYSAFATPALRAVPAPSIELGFTSLGPIVNLDVAISSSRKDSLIERVTLTVRHERGDTRDLVWESTNETQHKIRALDGSTADVFKERSATALKVITSSLTEVRIAFRSPEFKNSFNPALSSAVSVYQTFIGQEEPEDALLATPAFQVMQRVFHDQMFWHEGSYILELNLHDSRLRQPRTDRFRFVLGATDITILRRNFEVLPRVIRTELRRNRGLTDPTISWNWVYPELSRIEE
jgi:hypothetical protein